MKIQIYQIIMLSLIFYLHSSIFFEKKFYLEPFHFTSSTFKFVQSISNAVNISKNSYFNISFWLKSNINNTNYFTLKINDLIVLQNNYDLTQTPKTELISIYSNKTYLNIFHSSKFIQTKWTFIKIKLLKENQVLKFELAIDDIQIAEYLNYFPTGTLLTIEFCNNNILSEFCIK